jgi:hypothetical protein
MLAKYQGKLHFRDYQSAYSAFKSLVYGNEKTVFYVPREYRSNPTYFAVNFENDTTLIVDFNNECPPNFYAASYYAMLQVFVLAESGELLFSEFKDGKWIEINLKPSFVLLENIL